MTNRVLRILGSLVVVFGLVALTVPAAHADELADARAFITKQVGQIKQGNVAALKAGFTKRLQDRVTEANVKAAQQELGKVTVGELVASVAPAGEGLKIKMKNGRTLTTLVKVDGKWAADTIWFK
jgi:hypothetical protein